ncbi:MAG: ATP-sensitive inward rectifier potassium channel 10, partial [Pyrinomonadaceae bacterium]|nr:ATP-sensitive inward rectifier potassium channel 10 [Pyrinomonadaceae bacterium]
GIDETFSQTVHTRSSYKPSEIEWNAKFSDIYVRDADHKFVTIDVRKLSDTKKVEN